MAKMLGMEFDAVALKDGREASPVADARDELRRFEAMLGKAS